MMKNMFDKDKERRLQSYLDIIIGLEYLGVRIENTREEIGSYGFLTKTVYYYSVPELSTIEVQDNENLNSKVKTSDGLKLLTKETIIDIALDSYEKEFGEDKDFVDDVKNNISDYFKFCAKVRKGEIWNKEMGDNRVRELIKDIQNASSYSEV